MELTKFRKLYNRIIQKKVTNEHDEEIPKEKYVYLGERQNIIDDLLR